MPTTAGPNIVTDSLIYYVDAANQRSYVSGSHVLQNLGPENSGSFIDSVSSSFDSNPPAWGFDATYDRIEFENELNLGTNYTMEFWVKKLGTASSTWGGYLLSNNQATYQNPVIFTSTKNVSFRWSNSPWNAYWQPDATYFTEFYSPTQGSNTGRTFHQLVLTRSSDGSDNTIKVYVDGVLKDSTTSDKGATNPTYITMIGRNASGESLNGSLSIVKFYSKILSDTEISQNYNALKGRFS
jgi:hypothetical protein